MVTTITNGMSAMLTQVNTALTGALGQLSRFNKQVQTVFKSIGTNMASGIKSGLSQGTSAVVQAAKSMATQAYNAAKAALDIHSPSRKMRELGAYTSAGFAEGIADKMRAVDNAVGRMTMSALRRPAIAAGATYNSSSAINIQNYYQRNNTDVDALMELEAAARRRTRRGYGSK